MNDLLQNDSIQPEDNAVSISYCRKCGNKLIDCELKCKICGTLIENDCANEDAQTLNINENIDGETAINENIVKKAKNKKKIIWSSLLGAILLVIIISLGLFFFKTRIIPLDINSVRGCPEFYNLKWGMSAYDVDEKIELKHTLLPAFPEMNNSTWEISYKNDASILIEDEKPFRVYGKKTEDVFIYFNGNTLKSVIIVFSKEDYKFDEIVELYTKIYGQPTGTKEKSATWIGGSTIIDVLDYSSDDGDEEVVVMYEIGQNFKYTTLMFDGTELDPCSFLSTNYAFDKEADYYIDGLKEGDDYKKEVFSPKGFTGFSQYTLYPAFEYMGIEAGMTAIQFNQDANEESIGLVSYKFLLNEENAVDRMNYIKSKLTEKYGTPNDIGYTSTYYAKMGIKNLTIEEMMQQISENTEGIYHIQWKQGDRNITLGLTISVDKEYYEGSVSFSD